ncbi:elongation factor G [Lentisphaerota bacterium WC36G]|nr:elongation factor G [Lentisphaerae bacterium WC36]
MKDVSKVRNFVVAGHSGSGKTSLCDLMLFKSGAVDRLGKVSENTSISDYTTDEQAKQSSIYATPLHCSWNNHFIFFVDTPGYGEFIGEVICAMNACDCCLLTIDGTNGIEVGFSRAWRNARNLKMPKAIFVNKLDQPRADFFAVVKQLQETYGKNLCIPITLPVIGSDGIERAIHVLKDKDYPEELANEIEKYKEMLMDTIAESDEELMERYLEGEDLTEDEIATGLHEAIAHGELIPVFAGSVEKDIGIERLLNGVVNLFPHPGDRVFENINGEIVDPADEKNPAVARVFKSVIDPYIGQLTYFRVRAGEFTSDSDVFNINTGTKERFGTILLMNGKNQDKVQKAGPGFIGAMVKLKNTHTGNTLSSNNSAVPLPNIEFPNALMSYAVTAVVNGEEDKIANGIQRLAECDPTIRLTRHPETHEMLLSGMGDLHLKNVVNKLHENYKVDVNLATPKVPYRETIMATGEGHYRHKKQSGGHGQFGEVFLNITPISGEFEFENKVVGGSIPKNYIPAVEKGIQEALERGPLSGNRVENVKVCVYDGKHHAVDSSEMAFKIAARYAFKDAMEKAKAVLMEPIMSVRILIPDQFMGDISGDLNHKRGRILGMDRVDGMQLVNAEVPLSEMSHYATEIRSITGGAGSFEMTFERYEQLPSNIANDVIKKYQDAEANE